LRGKRENVNDPAYLRQRHLISYEVRHLFALWDWTSINVPVKCEIISDRPDGNQAGTKTWYKSRHKSNFFMVSIPLQSDLIPLVFAKSFQFWEFLHVAFGICATLVVGFLLFTRPLFTRL
jgi:hypothetical protein